jgi:hypothetical protein
MMLRKPSWQTQKVVLLPLRLQLDQLYKLSILLLAKRELLPMKTFALNLMMPMLVWEQVPLPKTSVVRSSRLGKLAAKIPA